jgi:predicted anti-sigma-YlaC factor YlaD
MKLEPQFLKQIVRAIVDTQPEEMDCDQCFEELDFFAEMVLAGKPAEEAMPLVQDHLHRCGPCREEFEALLDALKQLDDEQD